MGRNSGLVLTFFFSGLLLLGIGFLISKWMDADSPSTPSLAHVEKISDQVFILKKHLTQKEKLDKKSPLRALETIETNAEGEALLDFPSAYKIRVNPNTQITLDQEGDKTILYIKSGDIKIENLGRDGSVFIAKAGLRWSATEYDVNNHGPQNQQDPTLKHGENIPEGLTPSYILDTLKAQKGNFYKCYTQLLQKKPGITGETSISITIEPTGKISRSDVTTSKLDEPSFKKCLIEAAGHIEFKPFGGDAITTVFPLKFE
jgi:hypothetical protein